MTNAELIAELRGHIISVPLTLLHDAADALEAAEQRIAELLPKEGEWIREEHGHVFSNYYCSKCGAYAEDKIIDCEWNYCPNCGARMRG